MAIKYNKQSTTNGGSYSNKQSTKKPPYKSNRKVGEVDELGHHVFDVNQSNSVLFQETRKKICEYITTKYDGGFTIAEAIRTEEEPDWDKMMPKARILETSKPIKPKEPEEPEDRRAQKAYDEAMEAYKEAMEQYNKDLRQYEEDSRQNTKFNDKKLNQHLEKEERYQENSKQVYGIIWGQCTIQMKNKLQECPRWEEIRSAHMPIPLLKEIRKICQNYQDTVYPMIPICDALEDLLTIKQGDKEGLLKFRERFDNQQEITKSQYGDLLPETYYEKLPKYIEGDADKKQEIKEAVLEQLAAYLFMRGTKDSTKELLTTLGNSFAKGNDEYPKTVDDAVKAISNYKSIVGKAPRPSDNTRQGQAHYTQANKKQKPGNVNCSNCNGFRCPVSQGQSNKCNRPKGYKDWTKEMKDGYWVGVNSQKNQQGTSNSQTTQQPEYDSEAEDSSQEAGNVHFGTESSKPKYKFKKNKKKKGHLAAQYNTTKLEEQFGTANSTVKHDMIELIGLDTMSDTTICGNDKLMSATYQSPKQLSLTSTGGVTKTNTQGDAIGLPGCQCWFTTKAFINIFSFALMVKSKLFTFDISPDGLTFTVTRKSTGASIPFKATESDLYVCSVDDWITTMSEHPSSTPSQFAGVLLDDGKDQVPSESTSTAGVDSTPIDPTQCKCAGVAMPLVEEQKKLYTKQQVARAMEAKKFHAATGFMSDQDFKHMVQQNMVKDSPITVDDVKIMNDIFGPNVYMLKGKTVRTRPHKVVSNYIEIPDRLLDAHKRIVLCIDIMYVDNLPFFVTVSLNVKYFTAYYLKDRTKESLMKAIDVSFTSYNNAEFIIVEVRGDNEFECMREELEQNKIEVNLCSADEHEPNIERMIRFFKERYRTTKHSQPYASWPALMIVYCTYYIARNLNAFPPKGGISRIYSPRHIIERRPLIYNKHCVCPFGAYVQAHNDGDNSPEERTTDAIYLMPKEDRQHGHLVMSLKTGKPITRHKVTPCNTPPEVIRRVEQLAKRSGIKQRNTPMIRTYALDTGVDYSDSDSSDDESYTDSSSDDDSLTGYETDDSLPDLEEQAYDSDDDTDSEDETPPRPPSRIARKKNNSQKSVNIDTDTQVRQYNPTEPASDVQNQPSTQPKPKYNNPQSHATELPTPTPPRRSGRTRKPPEFLQPTHTGKSHTSETKHLFSQATMRDPETYIEYSEDEATIIAQCFIQTYSLKAGIKKFGDDGLNAAKAEFQQMHDRQAWEPVDINNYPYHVRRQVMNSLMFLVQKRDGRIKARHCANGSIQRNWYTKEESSSPTAHQESVMITAAIDAKEGRDVAIVDIPNAFIQTKNKPVKGKPPDILKVSGVLALMLVEMAPTVYEPFVTYEKGQPVLYLLMTKAVYGMLRSSLLFHQKLKADLIEAGFKFNPYDRCVCNKMVDGTQLTLVIHVDDIKVSHKKPKVVDNFIKWCQAQYDEYDQMKPSRGKVHDYLGVTLDYSEPGKVKLNMHDYIDTVLSDFPFQEQLKATRKVSSPAAEHLFNINPEATKLDKTTSEDFHTTVAKLLFLSKRTRPDLQPTVPFLCTRVQSPDEDDFKKLLRLLKWLESTKTLVLTLEVDGDGKLILVGWYADAAFAVHADMKSHTGFIGTLGKGAFTTGSSKQKLNTTSSTEAELVAAHEALLYALWTRLFLINQGYDCKSTIYRTTPVQFSWRLTEWTAPAREHDTWILDFSLSPIASRRGTSTLSSAQLIKCTEIIQASHCRARRWHVTSRPYSIYRSIRVHIVQHDNIRLHNN